MKNRECKWMLGYSWAGSPWRNDSPNKLKLYGLLTVSHFKATLHTWLKFILKYFPQNESVHIQKYRQILHSLQLDFCHKFSFIQKKGNSCLFFFQTGSISYSLKLYIQWLAGFLSFFFLPSPNTVPREQQWLTCKVLCLNGKCKTVLQKDKCTVSSIRQVQANTLAQLGS